MTRFIVTLLVTSLFGAVLAGCHASVGGGIDPNSASSVSLPR